MTTVTAPLASLALAAFAPDVVRSCIVQQPSPPPDPGEEPPAPVGDDAIYTPVPPGVTYDNLPTAPTVVDTSPDQMIGCIVTVADNPQGRLNALFPSAVDGDGVIDRATNDIWVYDGTTWNNVGPTPGPTIVATVVIPPWNEIVSADAITRTKLSVNALAYALELLTEPDPIVTTTALTVRSAPAFIRVPDTDFSFTVHVPAVAGGASTVVPLSTSVLAVQTPAVSSGGAVVVPSVNINVTAFDPDNAGKPLINIFTPAVNTVTTPYFPSLSTGVSISTNTFDISLAALTPAVYDPDAVKYIRAVETADSQTLEHGVKQAINTFVLGCKTDGTWSAIKAACILAGARTLAGALVPLAGTAPTNNNFVSGDYSRTTGLVGDGSTKYLDSNRAGNADPQDNAHLSVYITAISSGNPGAAPYYISSGAFGIGSKALFRSYQLPDLLAHGVLPTANTIALLGPNQPLNGFFGYSRSLAASFTYRDSGTTYTPSATSQVPTSDNTFVLARNNGSNVAERYSNARLAFYSIGESLDLALLDSRVTTLMSDIAAAIP